MTNDARLVLDTLRAAEASGAMLLNYAPLEYSAHENNLWFCGIRDQLTDKTYQLRAKTVVNAAGAWAPGFPASGVKLRLTKGVHIVIDRTRLNVPDAVVMAEGSRILFAIPWGERLILGTTDTDYDGPLDTPTCDEKDIDYILSVTNYTFPAAKISKDDVISTWSGLRPLISAGEKGTPSDISRAHQIREPHPGWIDVAGGKLTTYRLMAEQTVDHIAAHIGPQAGQSLRPCETATTPLLPGEPHPPFSGILPVEVSREAVEHYCNHEWAIHVYDIMIRRTSWRHYHRDHLAIARNVAGWMKEFLNWTDDQTSQELHDYRALTDSAACGFANTSPSVSRV